MRVKTVRRKGKMKPKEKGRPTSYKKLAKPSKPSLRIIKGIFIGWQKAPKYILRLKSTPAVRYYLSKKSDLTTKRRDALQFAKGYDNPTVKIEYWNRQLGLNFETESL